MITKSVTIFYELTQQEVKPPAIRELERKERWVKELQKTVEADYKPIFVKVTYEIHNPEIERLRRFFNGTCIKYYTIQNEDMVEGVPSNELLKKYRIDILDQMLGYDVHLTNRIIRERKSTSDFKTVQAWSKFLNVLQETIFDSAGYEFPESKDFWELVKQHGYDEAERISITKLQEIMKRKQ